ncbi:MAG: thioredoxin domain-containing protein [Rhodothermales bacterium]|nr:thioredoxin domain-containing protein [Rhodothermales bacterium]
MPRLFLLALLALGLSASACAQPSGEDTARDERILANVRHEFPRLQQVRLEVVDLAPSEIAGLQRGTLLIAGQQEQPFLLSDDGAQLFLLAAPPIDVSRSAEDLAAAQTAEIQERAEALEALTAGLPVRGNPDAPVTVVEFSDFQCPYCGRAADTVEEVLEAHGDDVRFVYLQYPLPNHAWARPASLAALCAAQQDDDAFWALHDAYFADQRGFSATNVVDKSREILGGTDVDLDAWNACIADEGTAAHQDAVDTLEAHLAAAEEFGVSGTPAFFVNGRSLSGAQPEQAFRDVLKQALAEDASG